MDLDLDIDAEMAADEDPPRSAFGLLQCPPAVVAGKEFALQVGLSDTPSPGAVGGQLERPAGSLGPYTLVVQVVSDVFELRAGETWLQTFRVTARKPYPATTLHLTARSADAGAGVVLATFTIDGQVVGFASRPVEVVAEPKLLPAAAAEEPRLPIDLALPTADTATDLTITILTDSGGQGELRWLIQSPHAIQVPEEAPTSNIGAQPAEFARLIVDEVSGREGTIGVDMLLQGIGRRISDHVPAEVWSAISDVARATAGNPPAILILSQEPYVPWELALMDDPMSPSAPRYLATQASVGRWIMAERRPKRPPPAEARVETIGVVFGDYGGASTNELPHANEEAEELVRSYSARPIEASRPALERVLRNVPPGTILHFAVHGTYKPATTEDGLYLADGTYLTQTRVVACDFETSRPIIFLNACQVGMASRMLGNYAGISAAFLQAGACAVIAPLWSVSDEVAKDIALEFYREAFNQTPLGEVMRQTRLAWQPTEETTSTTRMAYLLYAHPMMKVIPPVVTTRSEK